MLKFCYQPRRVISLILVFLLSTSHIFAGISITNTNGVTMTGADSVQFIGLNGVTMTVADGFLTFGVNGVTMTGADGVTMTGADGNPYIWSNGYTYTGSNNFVVPHADGVTMTGADGVTMTGADGAQYQADSVVIRMPNGVTMTGADGINVAGANGMTITGTDGVTMTGADGVTMTGADSLLATRSDGTTFSISPNGVTMTGADSIIVVRPTGLTMTGADGVTMTGADGVTMTGAGETGLKGFDPELAIQLSQLTDDSNINAMVVFHHYPTDADLSQLQSIGVIGGTRYRVLPMVCITATKEQLVEISRLSWVRSIYGNRTLAFNSDSRLSMTQQQRVQTDSQLTTHNNGMPVSGRGVTVAVLDTGVDGTHADLSGRVVQNVKLVDLQSISVGFNYPTLIENLPNTDLLSGHGTFVAGLVAGSGLRSGGKYNGVASGAKVLGLSAGDYNLAFVLAGFDYLLERGANYNVRVVNCSFSANVPFDVNDPVNVATKMLADRNITPVFSAGNTGPSIGTLNPYSIAPWVISVGTTDENGRLADFSSRGSFGSSLFRPTVVAPGVGVVSLRSTVSVTGVTNLLGGADLQRLSPLEMPFYTTGSGTSFTAPQVSGAIALMLEANPNLTPSQIKDILQRSATPLSNNYAHEVGAGMLNTYAAVIESAFPERRTGIWRASLDRKQVKFVNNAPVIFNGLVNAGSTFDSQLTIPQNTLYASVRIAWQFLSLNDLKLTLKNPSGNTTAQSNNINVGGLLGNREGVAVMNPTAGIWRANVNHTTGIIGTTQAFTGALEVTRIEYAPLADINNLSPTTRAEIYQAIRTYAMLPQSNKFKPTSSVTRTDLASSLLIDAKIPQFISGTQMYGDVRDISTRGIIESVQNAPSGATFYDVSTGGNFRPDDKVSRLVAAVALVRAAGLRAEAESPTAVLLCGDMLSIPASLRSYVAVALSHGLLNKQGMNFNPNQPLTRAELAHALALVSP